MVNSKKIILAIVIGLIAILALNKDILKKNGRKTANSYQHKLAILNKSYHKDLKRSINLYKSYEKYYVNKDKVPFYIVVPKQDLELFSTQFEEAKNRLFIQNLPKFLTDEEVLEKCDEPNIAYDGPWAQQVIKLCFGITNIAKNYIMIDSDNYFTKDFDDKIIFEKGTLKTVAWKLPIDRIEANKIAETKMFTDKCSEGINSRPSTIERSNSTIYNNNKLIKDFFNNRNSEQYGYVLSPCLFNSEALHNMKDYIYDKGFRFSMLIRIVSFEMQWYGEYIQRYEKFIPAHPLFTLISCPSECHPEDGGTNMYGIWFQSIIYDYVFKSPNTADNEELIYKRPAHCDH